MDLFDAHRQGRLQALLEKSNVAYDRSLKVDPYSFLPTWLHPR
jgi:cysteine synthase A